MRSFAVHVLGPQRGPLPTSFEQACDRLQCLPQILIEPDGSFAWPVNPTAGFRVDGMLYDALEKLQYVELKGVCGLMDWKSLIQAISPDPNLQIVRLSDGVLQMLHTFETQHWSDF